jgi:hypothetical protein
MLMGESSERANRNGSDKITECLKFLKRKHQNIYNYYLLQSYRYIGTIVYVYLFAFLLLQISNVSCALKLISIFLLLNSLQYREYQQKLCEQKLNVPAGALLMGSYLGIDCIVFEVFLQ